MKDEYFKNFGVTIPLTYKQIVEIGGVVELTHIKSHDEVLLTCGYCGKSFTKKKDYMYTNNKAHPNKNKNYFCSRECVNSFKFGIERFPKDVVCLQCGKHFFKKNIEFKKTKLSFCSRSCSAIYHNANKIVGTRVSKLELYLQQKLTKKYPNIVFSFNDKQTIKSELDICIPDLKLAFELNGIFHYESIFSESKLKQIQNNDNNKFQKCIEKGISLCVIDTSQQKHFTEKSSQKYLDVITKILDQRNSDLN